MDGLSEKKWFFYLGDHHEGPHTAEELREKAASGLISSASYVWAESMPDWKPITEIPELASVIAQPLGGQVATQGLAADAPTGATATRVMVENPEPSYSPSMSNVVLTPKESTKSLVSPAPALPMSQAEESPIKEKKVEGRMKGVIRLLIVGVVLAGVTFALMSGMLNPIFEHPSVKPIASQAGSAVRPLVLKTLDAVPALGAIISPIPEIEGATPQQMDELNTAALIAKDQNPKPIAVAINGNTQQPKFVIAGNFPDGMEFELLVEGAPAQMLGSLSYVGRARATISGRHGVATPLVAADGSPLPVGKFLVYVYESETQSPEGQALLATRQPTAMKLPETVPPGRKLVQKAPMFLGGPEDASFTQKLAEFHQQLRTQATSELTEIQQFADLFITQMNSTTAKFTGIKKAKTAPARLTPKEKADWAKYNDAEWSPYWTQIDQRLATWTPEELSKKFYGKLYQRTAELGAAVKALHDVHHKFFTAQVDAATVEPSRAQLIAQANGIAAEIKTRTDALVQANTANPNGLPQKEQH